MNELSKFYQYLTKLQAIKSTVAYSLCLQAAAEKQNMPDVGQSAKGAAAANYDSILQYTGTDQY